MPHYLCLRQCPRLNHRLLHINFLEFGKLGIWKSTSRTTLPGVLYDHSCSIITYVRVWENCVTRAFRERDRAIITVSLPACKDDRVSSARVSQATGGDGYYPRSLWGTASVHCCSRKVHECQYSHHQKKSYSPHPPRPLFPGYILHINDPALL